MRKNLHIYTPFLSWYLLFINLLKFYPMKWLTLTFLSIVPIIAKQYFYFFTKATRKEEAKCTVDKGPNWLAIKIWSFILFLVLSNPSFFSLQAFFFFLSYLFAGFELHNLDLNFFWGLYQDPLLFGGELDLRPSVWTVVLTIAAFLALH